MEFTDFARVSGALWKQMVQKEKWFSKWCSWAASITTTWGLIGNAGSLLLSKPTELETLEGGERVSAICLNVFSGDCKASSSFEGLSHKWYFVSWCSLGKIPLWGKQ